MHLAVCLQRATRQCFDLGSVRYVRGQTDHIGARRGQRFDDIAYGIAVDIGEHEFHAELCALLREGAAQTAGGARDDGDFVLEIFHLVLPLGARLGPVAALRSSSDLDELLAEILAVKQPDQRLGRAFEPFDDAFPVVQFLLRHKRRERR